jgi:hypothetical protein
MRWSIAPQLTPMTAFSLNCFHNASGDEQAVMMDSICDKVFRPTVGRLGAVKNLNSTSTVETPARSV